MSCHMFTPTSEVAFGKRGILRLGFRKTGQHIAALTLEQMCCLFNLKRANGFEELVYCGKESLGVCGARMDEIWVVGGLFAGLGIYCWIGSIAESFKLDTFSFCGVQEYTRELSVRMRHVGFNGWQLIKTGGDYVTVNSCQDRKDCQTVKEEKQTFYWQERLRELRGR